MSGGKIEMIYKLCERFHHAKVLIMQYVNTDLAIYTPITTDRSHLVVFREIITVSEIVP